MLYSLLERIIQLDTSLFFVLNVKVQNGFLDFLMPILTNLNYWRMPLALMVIALAVFGGKRGRIAIALLIVGITISDQLCNSLIKPLVGRIRPCNVLENVHLLINCTRSFSFPSSHATNMFTGTIILSYVYRRWRIVFLFIAFLVAYSRIYVGVHYPFDMLGGIVLGIICAWLVIVLYKLLSGKYPRISFKEDAVRSEAEIRV
ncbi:MAG: phosphatase PAP2 family protein [Candidatus Zixiibacteriota bacterium]